MKFKLFKPDGSLSSEKHINGFPALDDKKGVDALRQVILAVHANQRQGNASTKLRSEVSGSGKKLHRQKGLGVGRVGDKRSIQRRGGGVIFGPRPRSYNQKVNRKVKHLALVRALCDQASAENISLIEAWEVEEAKTKIFHKIVNGIVPKTKRVLIVDDNFAESVGRAARNLPNARLGRAQDLGALDIVQADKIIISLKGIEAILAKFAKQ